MPSQNLRHVCIIFLLLLLHFSSATKYSNKQHTFVKSNVMLLQLTPLHFNFISFYFTFFFSKNKPKNFKTKYIHVCFTVCTFLMCLHVIFNVVSKTIASSKEYKNWMLALLSVACAAKKKSFRIFKMFVCICVMK